jgi:hypothetical protein
MREFPDRQHIITSSVDDFLSLPLILSLGWLQSEEGTLFHKAIGVQLKILDQLASFLANLMRFVAPFRDILVP